MSRWLQTLLFCRIPVRTALALAALLLFSGAVAGQQPGTDPPVVHAAPPALTAGEIVSRLQERNREREEALREFEGTRVYHVQYHGVFGAREAEMVVHYRYVAPDQKEFTIVSQSGSKLLIDHVINGLLNAEKEAASAVNRQRTALTPANYDFTLADADGDASQYVLEVIPKNNNKFLYRGRIWIDAKDFAVSRIEAEPAKNPSLWVKKTEVRHRYEKVDDFWLPAQNSTDSMIRMGGHALLSIEYRDYRITEAGPLNSDLAASGHTSVSAAPAQNAALR